MGKVRDFLYQTFDYMHYADVARLNKLRHISITRKAATSANPDI